MVARRLVILMVVLFAASALAAALAPQPPVGEEEETTTEPAVSAPPAAAERGRLVRATLNAGGRKPRTIELREGDQLALLVRSETPGQVEIPALGLLDHVDPDTPARFDLLGERIGRLEVRLVEPPRTVGTIEVSRGEADAEPGEGSQASSSRGASSSASDRP